MKNVLLCFFTALTAISHGTEKPNIIAILVDDIGVGDFGFTGGKDFPTPHIDQLARGGCAFTHGYANPSCSPTRAAMLTGRYTQRFGLENNNKGALPLAELTIAERLKPAGYVTGQQLAKKIKQPANHRETQHTDKSSPPPCLPAGQSPPHTPSPLQGQLDAPSQKQFLSSQLPQKQKTFRKTSTPCPRANREYLFTLSARLIHPPTRGLS